MRFFSADTRRGPAASAARILLPAAETLFPDYFALVMATAVVSVASFLLGYLPIARALLALNWGFYLCLWVLTVLRLVHYPGRVLEDLFDHQRAPGFFTVLSRGLCVTSRAASN